MGEYIVGVKANGERIRFERWIYEYWLQGVLTDLDLFAALEECKFFEVEHES